MIEKKSLFELIGNNTTKYHSALLTTYTFDPIYFSTYYASKLKSCGITNIVVFVDASNYDKMMEDFAHYGNLLSTKDYTLIRQQPTGDGVFHPKLCMLIGQKQGLLLLGSGNLTYSGQSVNEEVWGCIWLNDENSPYLPMFGQVWNYLDSIIVKSSLAVQQMAWMREYSQWLEQAIGNPSDNVTSVNGKEISFIYNQRSNGIYSQLLDKIGQAKISDIEIVSPFYDEPGTILDLLEKDFHPQKIRSIVYHDGTYPSRLIQSNPENFVQWKATNEQRERLHAKIYQFKTDEGTYLLIGSANATPSAWGLNPNYFNDETVLLLHESGNIDYLKNLGISLSTGNIDKQLFNEAKRYESVEEKRYDITITSAEIIDGYLHVKTNKNLEFLTLGLLNSEGGMLDKIEYKPSEKCDVEKMEGIKAIVALSDDKEISNRYLVMSDSAVARNNPNPAGHKLSSLLNSSTHWDDNIAKILEFVSFDMPAEEKRNTRVALKAATKTDKSDKIITQEQFDDISTGSRYHVLSMNNIRIVDYFRRLIEEKNKQEDSEETDVNVTDEELENGTNNSGEEYYVEDLRSSEEKEERSIMGYIKKFNDNMSGLLSEFDSDIENDEAKHPNAPKRKPKMGNHKAGLNEYSSALILIVLIYQLYTRNSLITTNVYKLRGYLISALGRFLLYYHELPENTNDYRYRKICAMYKDLNEFTLLCTAKMDLSEGSNSYRDMRIIILNLFDFYRNDKAELMRVFDNYEQHLAEYNIDFNQDTVNLIKALYNSYMVFTTDKKEFIKDDWSCAIEWSKSNGFAYRDEFKPSKNSNGQYTSRYIPCGYRNGCFRIETGKQIKLFE